MSHDSASHTLSSAVKMLHNFVIALMRIVINPLVKIPVPELIEGQNSVQETPAILKRLGGKKPMIITDAMLVKLGLLKLLTDSLDNANIEYVLFDEVVPDPSLELVNSGIQKFRSTNADSIIAIGGGSSIDCAKAIGACYVTNKTPAQIAGKFKVRKKLPPFIAIPTTAGTGSECTVAAVVSDTAAKKKLAVVDPVTVPAVAILDPMLMLGLPPKITAETGVDALTHAVEAYIGNHATDFTRGHSIDAIKRIFKYLPIAYNEGSNVEARTEMAVASYSAGAAFTRTSVGYVHAIAHQLGGYYHIPHGLANAVVLPFILEMSYDDAKQKYAELALAANLASSSDSTEVAANKFVDAVKNLLRSMNIQTSFEQIKKQDIPELAKRAVAETYCNYPVPTLMSNKQCEKIISKLAA